MHSMPGERKVSAVLREPFARGAAARFWLRSPSDKKTETRLVRFQRHPPKFIEEREDVYQGTTLVVP
jgi:hypothetical protein